jgi:beta-lactamase class A
MSSWSNKKILQGSIIVILLISNVVLLILFCNARSNSIEESLNKYPLVDPSRSFIDQENYLTTIQPLREEIQKLVNDFGKDSVSLYIEYLNTGANISVNPGLYIWPASLTKVPLALATMKMIETGEWQMDTQLTLTAGDNNNSSGDIIASLSRYPVGSKFTIETLLEELLVHSDNTAYNILLDNVPEEKLTQVIQALGLESLFSKEGKISAKEYSRILRALYGASFLTRDNSQRILMLLNRSTFKEFLSTGMPEDVVFAHKYGEHIQLGVFTDSGIVYIPNKPYLISVMVQTKKGNVSPEEQRKVSEFMKRISSASYEFFSTAKNNNL